MARSIPCQLLPRDIPTNRDQTAKRTSITGATATSTPVSKILRTWLRAARANVRAWDAEVLVANWHTALTPECASFRHDQRRLGLSSDEIQAANLGAPRAAESAGRISVTTVGSWSEMHGGLYEAPVYDRVDA